MTLGARGALPTSVTQPRRAALGDADGSTVTSKGSTKIDLSVSGARQGTPFWLVLGQSNNAGWEATVAGDDLGGSTLVDGYANGWLVRPDVGPLLGDPRGGRRNGRCGSRSACPAVALVVCLFLALRRRRRRGA